MSFCTLLRASSVKINKVHSLPGDYILYSPISIKNITSTMESTTSSETSSEVLFLKATLYGT